MVVGALALNLGQEAMALDEGKGGGRGRLGEKAMALDGGEGE